MSTQAKEFKHYKGYIMLFGLFRIRRDFGFYIKFGGFHMETNGSPYIDNASYIKRLEPFIRNICTIKWIEFDPKTEDQVYYY